MNDPEWLVKHILRHCGADTIVAHLPEPFIDHVLKIKTFYSFGITELAMILAYTDIKDTYAIMQTCKMWYVATQQRHFWKRRIEKALIGGTFMPLFDTFSSPIQETLRDQVEWLFKKNWIEERKNTVVRRSQGHSLEHRFHSDNREMESHCWFVPFSGNNFGQYEGKYVRVYINGRKYLKRVEQKKYGDKEAMIEKHLSDGSVWVGEALNSADKKRIFHPHGSGKWTFADGTTLEGEGVAWKGEPRKPVKRLKTDV